MPEKIDKNIGWRDSLEHPAVRNWVTNQLLQQPKEMAILLRDNQERWRQVYGNPHKQDSQGMLYWYLPWLGLELVLLGGVNGTMLKFKPLSDPSTDEKVGLGIVSFYQHLLAQLF